MFPSHMNIVLSLSFSQINKYISLGEDLKKNRKSNGVTQPGPKKDPEEARFHSEY